ncbi:MAG: hypothetical protein P8P48_07355 [Saprospiraceae bacterium]|nr:hypothetical protein [Saprospiraceae bacterium]
MKTTKLLPLLLCISFACNNEEIHCLDTKEVVIESINPSISICSTPDNDFHVVNKWDTTYSSTISECDAKIQLGLLEEAWGDLIIHYEALGIQSTKDSIYADFIKNNPAVYRIIDSGF